MYTVREIAEILKLPAASVRDMLRRGIIHHYRIGMQYRISEEHLQNYLKSVEENVTHVNN